MEVGPSATILIWWLRFSMMKAISSIEDRLLGTEFYILIPNKMPSHCLFHLYIFEPTLTGTEGSIVTLPPSYWYFKQLNSSLTHHVEELSRVDDTFNVTTESQVGITLRISCNFTQFSVGELAEYRAVPRQFWGDTYSLAFPINALCGTVMVFSLCDHITYTIRIRKGPSEIDPDHFPDPYVTVSYVSSGNTYSEIINSEGEYDYNIVGGGQKLDLTATYWDLTGSTISADGPFQVIVGPGNTETGCMVEKLWAEQMMPSHVWGTQYIVHVSSGDRETNVNVVVLEADTTVWYEAILPSLDGYNKATNFFNEGSVLPIQYVSGSTKNAVDVIKTSKPAMVLLSYNSISHPDLDVAFTQVVPLDYQPDEVVLFLQEDHILEVLLAYDQNYDIQATGYSADYTSVIFERVGSLCLASTFNTDLHNEQSLIRYFINVTQEVNATLGVSGMVVSRPAGSHQSIAAHTLGWRVCPAGQVCSSTMIDCPNFDSTTTVKTESETTTTNAEPFETTTNGVVGMDETYVGDESISDVSTSSTFTSWPSISTAVTTNSSIDSNSFSSSMSTPASASSLISSSDTGSTTTSSTSSDSSSSSSTGTNSSTSSDSSSSSSTGTNSSTSSSSSSSSSTGTNSSTSSDSSSSSSTGTSSSTSSGSVSSSSTSTSSGSSSSSSTGTSSSTSSGSVSSSSTSTSSGSSSSSSTGTSSSTSSSSSSTSTNSSTASSPSNSSSDTSSTTNSPTTSGSSSSTSGDTSLTTSTPIAYNSSSSTTDTLISSGSSNSISTSTTTHSMYFKTTDASSFPDIGTTNSGSPTHSKETPADTHTTSPPAQTYAASSPVQITTTTETSMFQGVTTVSVVTNSELTTHSEVTAETNLGETATNITMRSCPCRCISQNQTYQERLEEVRRQAQRIEDYLRVNRSDLHSTRMKLESATDSRTSSQTLGGLGISLLTGTACLILWSDLIYLCKRRRS